MTTTQTEEGRTRVVQLLKAARASVTLVAHVDEGDPGLRRVYVHDPTGEPVFIGVCAANAERILFMNWMRPWPIELIDVEMTPSLIEWIRVYQWPVVPEGYPTRPTNRQEAVAEIARTGFTISAMLAVGKAFPLDAAEAAEVDAFILKTGAVWPQLNVEIARYLKSWGR